MRDTVVVSLILLYLEQLAISSSVERMGSGGAKRMLSSTQVPCNSICTRFDTGMANSHIKEI